LSKETLSFVTPPPKNYKISSAFSYNFKLALTVLTPEEQENVRKTIVEKVPEEFGITYAQITASSLCCFQFLPPSFAVLSLPTEAILFESTWHFIGLDCILSLSAFSDARRWEGLRLRSSNPDSSLTAW
jgi:hypothetical protein